MKYFSTYLPLLAVSALLISACDSGDKQRREPIPSPVNEIKEQAPTPAPSAVKKAMANVSIVGVRVLEPRIKKGNSFKVEVTVVNNGPDLAKAIQLNFTAVVNTSMASTSTETSGVIRNVQDDQERSQVFSVRSPSLAGVGLLTTVAAPLIAKDPTFANNRVQSRFVTE